VANWSLISLLRVAKTKSRMAAMVVLRLATVDVDRKTTLGTHCNCGRLARGLGPPGGIRYENAVRCIPTSTLACEPRGDFVTAAMPIAGTNRDRGTCLQMTSPRSDRVRTRSR
jgi:hypothetical protein